MSTSSSTNATASSSINVTTSNADELHLVLRTDYPPKQEVVKFPSSLTFGQFKAECAKALGMKDLNNYDFRSIVYGQDVNQLGLKDTQSVIDAGVKTRSTIYISAPANVKPQKIRPLKKSEKKKEKEEKEDKKDRYKGLTVKNILKKFESNLKPNEEKIALEFVDIHASKIFALPEFSRIDKKTLLNIIKRETLSINEGEVFEAVVNWGKAECKNAGEEASTENLQKVLADLLPHVRFTTMSMQDVASKVTPTGLLTSDQMLQIFTYLGSKEGQRDNIKVPWTTKPRKGRRPLNFFSWDPNRKGNGIILSEKNLIATCTSSSWNSVFGDIELSSGVHEWEIVLDQYDTSNSYNVAIGVVPSSFTNWMHTTLIGYNTSSQGWCFVTGNGQKCNNSSPTYYGTSCSQGSIIRVRLDLDKHTIEFSVNGVAQGIAYTNVYGPVRPALSMVTNQVTTLRFPK